MSKAAKVSDEKGFDFESAKRKLSQVRDLEEEARLTKQIFQERARALARPTEVLDRHVERDHLAFSLGAVRFCCALTSIRTVFVPSHVAVIPGTPAHLREVIHFDGRIVSLVDLLGLLGVESAADAQRARARQVVLLEARGTYLGCPVDEISGLFSIHSEALVPSTHGAGQDFVLGIASDMRLVIDAVRLFTHVQTEKRSYPKETP
jgi:chemotaxis signal transduction protein